jgi:hypothetical protein
MMATLTEWEVTSIIKLWLKFWDKRFIREHPFKKSVQELQQRFEVAIRDKGIITEWEIALIIDGWYFEMKPKFVGAHSLGFAKEDLKQRIAKEVAIKSKVDHAERKDKKLEDIL